MTIKGCDMKKGILFIFLALFVSAMLTEFAFAKGPNRGTGNVVSQAAHKAKAEGIKGKELAAKVHEAIEERKESKEALEIEEEKETHKMRMRRRMHKHHRGVTTKGDNKGKNQK